MLATLMPGARASFEDVAAQGTVVLPMPFPGKWVDDHVAAHGRLETCPARAGRVLARAARGGRGCAGPAAPVVLHLAPPAPKAQCCTELPCSPADIILNPGDAAANGVVHGDKVRVRTSRGEIFLTANVSDTIRPGVASIPHGHEVANVNLLTSVQMSTG